MRHDGGDTLKSQDYHAGLRALPLKAMECENALLDVDPAAAVDRRVVEVKIRLEPSDLAAQLVNLQVDVAIDVHDR